MAIRRSPPENRVEFLHDGELLEAAAGESLAHALIAAERLVLARSPKLHRPRGPFCLRGACDGCLVRMDGRPNVMACRTRLRGGESVETQNVLGSRELDLLNATDFLFPHGIDAHRLLTSVTGATGVVTRLARRIAGLGRLPDEAAPVRGAKRRELDVLIVGGGRTGLALASALGARATLVDDALELGGRSRLFAPELAAAAEARARAAGAVLLGEATALGAYREPDDGSGRLTVPCSRAGQILLFRVRSLVLASGCHDAVPGFAGADLPGVFSARAGLELEAAGIVPDPRIVLVGAGAANALLAQRLGSFVVARVDDPKDLERAIGKLRLRGVSLRSPQGLRRLRAGVLFYDATPAPAFELAVQAGGQVEYRNGVGYVPRLDGEGRAAPAVHCVGSMTGSAGNGALEHDASVRAVVQSVLAELARDGS
jgi:sarcosine oxidase, subunit alpha